MGQVRSHHVIPNAEGGWDIMCGQRMVSRHNTQDEAVKEATRVSRAEHSDVVVFNKDGLAHETSSFRVQSRPREIEGQA